MKAFEDFAAAAYAFVLGSSNADELDDFIQKRNAARAELEQLLDAARPFSVRPKIVKNVDGRDFVPLDMAYVDALAAALKGTK